MNPLMFSDKRLVTGLVVIPAVFYLFLLTGALAVAAWSCCDKYETTYETINMPTVATDGGFSFDADQRLDSNEVSVKQNSVTGRLYTTKTTGNPVTLQLLFPPNEDNVHTVVFDLKPPHGPKALDSVAYATAQVDWMIGGSEVSRIVTLANGQSISGVGEGVKVTMHDATPIYNVPGNQTLGLEYSVTAAVAPGTRGSNSLPPTFTPTPLDPSTPFQYALLAPGASVVVQVPTVNGVVAGATSVQVLAVDNNAGVGQPANASVIQFSAAGLGANTALRWTITGAENDFIPLHPLCTQVVITNQSTTDDIAVSVTFGIDG